MKLKKIASLALAGVMAVSMLTACNGNGDDGKGEVPPVDNTVTTSDVVSTIDKAMKDYNSNATINVKESDFLNARIDALVKKASYQELSKNNYKAVELAIESAFGKKMDDLTAANLEAKNLASDIINRKDKTVLNQESWFYAVMDEGTVSGTTALVAAANHLGEQMKGLKDSFLVDSKSHIEIGGGYLPGKPGTVNTQIACNAGYTMYVYQFNATSTGDTSVPLTIAVLKVNVSQKV